LFSKELRYFSEFAWLYAWIDQEVAFSCTYISFFPGVGFFAEYRGYAFERKPGFLVFIGP